jgi:hypothetical protein
LEHPVDLGFRHAAVRARVPQSRLIGKLGDRLERVVAGRVALEHARHQWAAHRVDVDPMRHAVVDVADRSHRGPVSLFRLFPQPLLDFLAQVVDVVLRHQHLDAVQELVGRAGLLRIDGILLDEVHDEVELIDRDPVLDVAVEPIGLLDEHRATGGIRLAVLDFPQRRKKAINCWTLERFVPRHPRASQAQTKTDCENRGKPEADDPLKNQAVRLRRARC